ncbi:hypothetical protein I6A84_40675 [Frankia sp. CNm7]|uniref:Uncharacterized protein n=1 Tax=Frankia nepalensis TaxID=1836974 RepID=A0A937UP73_9ACTN|nr:hypothetical protein [Frankia nepalensis]MBL7501922.1 hypothetical protein [Frankia nepalensis]MBL7514523.1 hypothetical protein [Frankia nepalensis]MBL7524191.1 hypothetical protein [Frankia nepalensis]MBL7628798.1 hypothetical protein [Frankia nepalensis]
MAKRKAEDEGFRHINFFHAMLLKAFGPPELGENGPLAGTRYDPALKRARAQRQWEERRARQAGRQRPR